MRYTHELKEHLCWTETHIVRVNEAKKRTEGLFEGVVTRYSYKFEEEIGYSDAKSPMNSKGNERKEENTEPHYYHTMQQQNRKNLKSSKKHDLSHTK